MPREAKLGKHEGQWFTKAGNPSGVYFGSVKTVSYKQAMQLFRNYLAKLSDERKQRKSGLSTYASAAKRARMNREAILFVHSHPEHYAEFSPQDDREDAKLSRSSHPARLTCRTGVLSSVSLTGSAAASGSAVALPS